MVAISLLFIYMTFLLCLDPLMNQSGKTKKPANTTTATRAAKHYERQVNDELQVDNPTQECVFSEPTAVGAALPVNQRSSTVLNMVTHGQTKWRKQVCRFSLIESSLLFAFSRYNNNGNQSIINMNYLISHSKVNQIKKYVHKLPI